MKVTFEQPGRILLTGATGYIGGRLLRRLEAAEFPIRCMARRPEVLLGKVAAGTEVVKGDVLDRASLDSALEGIDVAYYLVHSMGSSDGFEQTDREAAIQFGQAAKAAGVRRVIYVGGLGRDDENLSPHLRSRHEVGHLLRESGVGVVEFRASVVIGSGSLSFEMIRALVERLPFMVAPKWTNVKAQPIAIDDLLAYLLLALPLPANKDGIYEIGGADCVSYGDLMHEYARQRGLRVHMIPVPFLTPYLSSLWLGLVTPLYARVGRKLITSLTHSTIVRDAKALEVFPLKPVSVAEAVRKALAREDQEFVETRWSDAMSSLGSSPRSYGGVRFGTRLVDSRTIRVAAPASACFAPIQAIGGETGWYRFNWLWRLRGFLDLLVGGPGMRRGRHHPYLLKVGDTLDFWRVEEFEPDRRLRLFAEMKLPGRAWLEFEVTAEGEETLIRQTAMFDPIGWLGRAYWYGIYPLHDLIFGGMLKAIGQAAERRPPEKPTQND
ncbi:MAG: hypothetical protein ACI8Q9_001201 [Planctomycetota bacterium]|jgi:uncharacterized protein YbjT (DUF2867 family)